MRKPTVASKTCRRCDRELPAGSFSPSATLSDGLRRWCRACESERRKERRIANLAVERERERVAARKRYRADPETFRQRTRDAYAENPEKNLMLARAWREKYPERQAAADRRWYEANREKAYSYGAKRRALKLGATVGPIDLESLWTSRCALCGQPIDEQLTHPDPLSKSVDHIIPLSRGGSHEQSNLQWTHLRCNLKKGDRP